MGAFYISAKICCIQLYAYLAKLQHARDAYELYVYLSFMVLLNPDVEWLFAVIQKRDINSKQVGYEVRNSVIYWTDFVFSP